MDEFLNLAKRLLFVISWCTLVLVKPLSAAIPSTPELDSQRESYQSLKKKIRQTSKHRLNSLVSDLDAMNDYPLFPYLYYDLVSRNISYSNRNQINAFLKDTKGLPVRNKLLKKWLKYLAKNNYKTLFLEAYEAGLGTDLLCSHLHIDRVKNGVNEAWYQQVEVIWLSGYSLPDSCNSVLAHWIKQGKLIEPLAIERMSLAGKAGQKSLSNYLKRFAPNNAHYISDLWAKVRRNPALSLSTKHFPFTYSQYDEDIAQWGLVKMSWRDPHKVIKALPQWEKSGKLSDTSVQTIKETVAISLTLAHKPDAQEWLMRAASSESSHGLWRWYLLNTVRSRDWSEVVSVVKTAPVSIRNSSEFQYWYARGLTETNEKHEANSVYQALAKERHYYGFFAAARINLEPVFNHESLLVDEVAYLSLQEHPQAIRARELFVLGEYVNARREWFALRKTLSGSQIAASVKLAYDWNWHDQAIVGALKAGANNDLAIRFPTAYDVEVEEISLDYKVDPSLVFAIARRESSFMEDAVSSANARGLMQLLPSTATFLLNSGGIVKPEFERKMKRKTVRYELFKGASNIEFGASYLNYLERKVGSSDVLKMASYNAGWQKVMQWLPEKDDVPIDIWIDTIPFKETREYVKAILAYQLIYDWQRNQPTNRFNVLMTETIKPNNN
ncbi:transglycosylase SLT domain-containing protein [Alteromonas sp. 5E99-2]|nr:transglycosylase SLT domain-containing protein [Alteromonas sp. 5E99-2]